jgi:hypothetical protein
MNMKKVFVLAAALFCCGGPVQAGDEIAVSSREQQSVSVTIYNKNVALVRDRRTINLPEGVHMLAFREISARIKPETAVLYGGELNVHEQRFEYDLLTPQSLLRSFVGREVTMSSRHPVTGEEQSVQAKVLSAGDGVVLQVGNRIETEVSGRLIFPDLPDNLRDRPTLIMQVESGRAGGRDVELSYLTGGLSWQADYVAELNTADDRLDLRAWVTLTNESGAEYPQARLQLVAGDVNIVQPELAPRPMLRGEMAAGTVAAAQSMTAEPLFAYHLYSVDRPITIGEQQKKQVALLRADGVRCDKEYLLQGQDYYFRAQVGEIGRKMKVGVFVEVKNDKETGLGQPLPGGVVRVYKRDGSGLLQFVGEDKVNHTPEKEMIRLHLGNDFDLTAEKLQSDFKKLKGNTPSQYDYESEYVIKLKNAKKEQVIVKVQEPIPGDWEILSESLPHVKEGAHAASWRVAVPPMEMTTLTYRVRLKGENSF